MSSAQVSIYHLFPFICITSTPLRLHNLLIFCVLFLCYIFSGIVDTNCFLHTVKLLIQWFPTWVRSNPGVSVSQSQGFVKLEGSGECVMGLVRDSLPWKRLGTTVLISLSSALKIWDRIRDSGLERYCSRWLFCRLFCGNRYWGLC